MKKKKTLRNDVIEIHAYVISYNNFEQIYYRFIFIFTRLWYNLLKINIII